MIRWAAAIRWAIREPCTPMAGLLNSFRLRGKYCRRLTGPTTIVKSGQTTSLFRKSDVVRPDFTIVVGPVKRLQYFPRSLNEFKSPAIGVHGSRIAQRIAAAHRIIS